MMRTTVPRWLLATTGILAAWVLPAADRPTAHAAEPAAAKLIPVTAEAIAGREKSLAENAPERAKLLAYLDCGSQQQSTTGKEVTIVCLAGVPYRFPSEAKDVLPSQSTVFYSTAEVPFRIDGLKRSERYVVGLSWWDYDNGGRTQSVVTGSPDGQKTWIAQLPSLVCPKRQSKYGESGPSGPCNFVAHVQCEP